MVEPLGPEGVAIQDSDPAFNLRDALVAACALPEEWQRTNALVALVPYLPETLLPEALAVARAISDEWARALVLTALVPRLPEGQQKTILPEALAAGRATSDKRRLAHVLTALEPFLPGTLSSEALTVFWVNNDEEARAKASATPVTQVPEGQSSNASTPSQLGDEPVATDEFTTEEWNKVMLQALKQVATATLDSPEHHLAYIRERLSARNVGHT